MLRRIFARQVILKCIKTPVFIETSGFFIRSALFSIDERRNLKLPNVCGRLPEFNGQIGKTDVIELTLSGVYAKIIKVIEKRKNLAGMCFFGSLVSFGGEVEEVTRFEAKRKPDHKYCGREPMAGETRLSRKYKIS